MELRHNEILGQNNEAIVSQLELFSRTIKKGSYPDYPLTNERLVTPLNSLDVSSTGNLVIPDGPWTVNKHPKHGDIEPRPNLETQYKLAAQGLELDSNGRPLHPWFKQMLEDSEIGILTGRGMYRNWGPNQTADSIIIQNEKVLLIKRWDTGDWALPGGFRDGDESILTNALRELEEETGIVVLPSSQTKVVYMGPVVDPRMTANAWPETTAILFPVEPSRIIIPIANDDAESTDMKPIKEVLESRMLFGSHEYLLRQAIKQMGGQYE